MNSFPIHLPDGFLVHVTPTKTYGNFTGKELIQRYSKRRIRDFSQVADINTNKVFISSGLLKKRLKVNGNTYDTRKYFNWLESKTGTQVLYKRHLRAKKHFQNCTLILPTEIV